MICLYLKISLPLLSSGLYNARGFRGRVVHKFGTFLGLHMCRYGVESILGITDLILTVEMGVKVLRAKRIKL